MEKAIEKVTGEMLSHLADQNIGVAVGATMNVLMTVFNYAPEDMRGHIVKHVRMIADQLEAVGGPKQ